MTQLIRPNEGSPTHYTGQAGEAFSSFGNSVAKAGFNQINRGSELGSLASTFSAKGANEYEKGQNMMDEASHQMDNVRAETYLRFDIHNKAVQSAEYSKHLSESTQLFNQLSAQRVNQFKDSDGNPTDNFKTLPQDIDQIGTDVLNKQLKGIDDPMVADEVSKNFNFYKGNKGILAKGIQRSQQMQYIGHNVTNSIASFADSAMTAPTDQLDYYRGQISSILNTTAQAGAITPEQAQAYMSDYMGTVQKGRMRLLIESNPAAAVDAFKEHKEGETNIYQDMLGLHAEGGRDVPPELGTESIRGKDRIQLQIEAQNALDRANRQAQAATNAFDKKFSSLSKELDKTITSGGTPDPELVDKFMKMGDSANPLYRAKVDNFLIKQRELQQFNQFTSEERGKFLDTMKLMGGDPTKLKMYDTISKRMDRNENDDLFGTAVSQGFIPEQKPIDFSKPLGDQLAARVPNIDVVESKYGKKTSGLTANEISGLKERYNNASSEDKIKMIGEINKSMGSYSSNVWTDIAKKGDSSASRDMAVLGSMVQSGQQDLAVKTIQGLELLKDERFKDALPKGKDESGTPVFSDPKLITMPEFSNPYYKADFHRTLQGLYMHGAYDKNAMDGKYDEETYKTAIEQATNSNPNGGGAIGAFNSGGLIPPVKGMNRTQFEMWVEGIDQNQIKDLGGIANNNDPKVLMSSKMTMYAPGVYQVWLPVPRSYPWSKTEWVPAKRADNPSLPFLLDYNQVEESGTRGR